MTGRWKVLSPVALAAVLLLGGLPAGGQRKGAEPGKQRSAVFTGCVDQDGEDYVLREPHHLNEVAILEPEGFPRDGLAKYVGQTVRVRGSKVSEAGKVRLRARSVETISEGCSPVREQ